MADNDTHPFAAALETWYASHGRDLPWRGTHDPYRIWVSEIILQQTRVAQGYDYFVRFMERFPTVGHLAAATEDDVLRAWQGLGYYTRARNLHAAARAVVAQGFIEKSNVNAVLEMSALIETNRLVDMYQKVMKSHMDELNSEAITKLAVRA